MSENRTKYSSAPLQDLRRRPPRQPQTRPNNNTGAAKPSKPAGRQHFVILQVMLIAVLPLAFLASLIIKDTRFYWAFIAASLICLASMFLLKAFVANARQVLGVIHGAMIAVALFAIIVTGPPQQDTTAQLQQNNPSIFNENTTASIVEMSQALQQAEGSAAQNAASQSGSSAAQQKLELFMSAWSNKDYAAMVSYSSPSWVNQHEDQMAAETSIFYLSAIRTPLQYNIQDVSGNDADQTRTITLQASISKNDGREPQLYNFQILMVKVNNEWYVDPNSISSSQVVQQPQMNPIAEEDPQVNLDNAQTPAQQAAAAQAPANTVRSDTVLFYNQDGGEYYHVDPNCSSIGARYKPLTATFYYRDVSNDTFKNLKPCPTCKSPQR